MGGSPFGGMGGMGGMGRNPFGGAAGPAPQRRKRPAKKSPPKERKVKAADGSQLTQRGDSIHSDLRIPFDQAMLGVVANVPTLTGTAKVTIPAGTSSGQKLRLKGKGARSTTPAVAKGRSKTSHGDHFVTVHIDVPKVEADESRDLLAKLVKLVEKDETP